MDCSTLHFRQASNAYSSHRHQVTRKMTLAMELNTPRPIAGLRIPFSLKTILAEAGYKTAEDLSSSSVDDLIIELSISRSQAEEIERAVQAPNDAHDNRPQCALSPIKSSTAAELLTVASSIRFSTFSASIDRLIAQFAPYTSHKAGQDVEAWNSRTGGAIVPGMTVEFTSPPGGGKSVIACALALSARVTGDGPELDDAEVLIIDTEGAISPSRLQTLAETTFASTTNSVHDVLRGIHLVRITTQLQMIGFLHGLDEWIEAHPKVKLVIIDTLSYHFRQPNMDMNAKRRITDSIKQKIGVITAGNRCAVVVMNQLATKLLTVENKPANFETGDRAVLMPQLGDSWTTGKTLRVVLFRGRRGDDLRYAHASSSGGGDEDDDPYVKFDITPDGLPCDLHESEL